MNINELMPSTGRFIKEDGTITNIADQMNVGNTKISLRDDFSMLNAEEWQIVQTGNGHCVDIQGSAAGSRFLRINAGLSPDTETILLSNDVMQLPAKIGAGVTISQRVLGQEFSLEMVEVDKDGIPVVETPRARIGITTLSRVSNIVTATTSQPHGFQVGDRISLAGMLDTNFMGGSYVIIGTPADNKFTYSHTAADSSTTGGIAALSEPIGNSASAAGILWDGTSSTNAIYSVKAAGCSPLVSSSSAFNSTVAAVPFAGYPQFLSGSVFEILANSDYVGFASFSADSQSASTYFKRTQNLPDPNKNYKLRIRVKNLPSFNRIVGKIQSISRATNVVTVTTDVAHGLSVGNVIGITGVQDQTNFANANSYAITGVTATSFTYAHTGANATSAGGIVSLIPSGGNTNSLAITNVSRTGNILTVTTSAAHGYLAGLHVQLTGINNAAGLDGAYSILSAPTSTTFTVSSSGANIAATQSGGAVTAMTDFRVHFARAVSFTRHITEIAGGTLGRVDANSAIPVNIGSNGTIGVYGIAAHDSAVSGSPVRISGRALSANYTTVSTGDVADLITTLVGALIQKPYSIPEHDWQYCHATSVNSTTDVVLKAAGATGIRSYLTGVQYQNTSATATEVVVKDGTTIIWRGYAPANMTLPAVFNFNTPLKGSAATALNFACITASASIYVNAQGYQAP